MTRRALIAAVVVTAATVALAGCGTSAASGSGDEQRAQRDDFQRADLLDEPVLPDAPRTERLFVNRAPSGGASKVLVQQIPTGTAPAAAWQHSVATLERRGVGFLRSGCNADGSAYAVGLIGIPSTWPGASTWETSVTVTLSTGPDPGVAGIPAPYVQVNHDIGSDPRQAEPPSSPPLRLCLAERAAG